MAYPVKKSDMVLVHLGIKGPNSVADKDGNLVGVFDLLNFSQGAFYLTGVVLLMFILPAVLNWLISELMRNKVLIQFGDMKLDD